MFHWLPDWLRPTGKGLAENIIAGAVLWGVSVILSAALAWLAAPQSDKEWVKWFLCSLIVFSVAWVAFAFGWRKLYPIFPQPYPALPQPSKAAEQLAGTFDADWLTELTDLVPITEFLRQAEERGWRFVDPKSQAMEFFELLREASAGGSLTLYGVRVKSGTISELSGPRVKIEPTHWNDFRVDVIGCFELNPKNGEVVRVKSENAHTRTYKLTHETGYVNLHVVGKEAHPWLNETLLLLSEAATRAYEQTRGSLAAKMAEETGETPITWYAYALWQRMPVCGCFPPSRLLEAIPDDEKKRFSFHWNGLDLSLKQYSGKARYENLRVRGSELKQAIRSISELG
jgi:hypothetical protein